MKKITARDLAETGVFAALVFAASGIRFVIPLAVGNTAIHLGNVLCILSGLLLGGIRGGLAAGIGSCFYDLTNPLYVASSPFTLAFKFCIGFITGKIAYAHGRNGINKRFNILGAILGSLACAVPLAFGIRLALRRRRM